MRLEHLPDQADVADLVDRDQGDGQVARDAILPEPGLAFDVLLDPLRGGSQQPVGVQEVAGQLLEAPGVIRLDAQDAHLQLRGGPCKVHGAKDGVRIARTCP